MISVGSTCALMSKRYHVVHLYVCLHATTTEYFAVHVPVYIKHPDIYSVLLCCREPMTAYLKCSVVSWWQ